MSTPVFNRAIEEQLKLLIEAPRAKKKNTAQKYIKTNTSTDVSSVNKRRITTGTGTSEGSGV